MVPSVEPSSRTSIRELSKLGIEPLVWTIVASAPRCPERRIRTISSKRSMSFSLRRVLGLSIPTRLATGLPWFNIASDVMCKKTLPTYRDTIYMWAIV